MVSPAPLIALFSLSVFVSACNSESETSPITASDQVTVVESKKDVQIDPDNRVTVYFGVSVKDCARSEGDFDYIFAYKRSNGDPKSLRASATWPRQDTKLPITVTDMHNLGPKEEYVDYEFDEITRFVCQD